MDKLRLQRAFSRTRNYRRHTPLIKVDALCDRWDAEVYVKCEQLQPIGAFKIRGASNFVLQLDKAQRNSSLVTHSSGNHAQAVAYMANKLGIDAHVVMPSNSNKKKIENANKWGAYVHLCNPTFEDRVADSNRLADQHGSVMIPPFDHEWIVEGQATCAMEVLFDLPDVDVMVAPLGGGGLLAGTALGATYFGNGIEVIGAEPENAADGHEGLKKGSRVTEFKPDTIADGLRTTVGVVPFKVLQENNTEVILAKESSIVPWMKRMWSYTKQLIEPSCAVPFAAMDDQQDRWRGKKIVVIVTGGNVDIDQFF